MTELQKAVKNDVSVVPEKRCKVFTTARASEDFYSLRVSATNCFTWMTEGRKRFEEFDDPEAVKDVTDGTFYRFNNEKTEAAVIKNLSHAKLIRSSMNNSFLISTVVTMIVLGGLLLPSSPSLNFMMILAIFICLSSFGVMAIINFPIKLVLEGINSVSYDKNSQIKKNDELFFFEVDHPIWGFIEKSDELSRLVERKARSYPTGKVMNDWCVKVEELLKLQPDFDAKMIPVMNDDLGLLVDKLDEKLTALRIESNSITDDSREGAREIAKMESKASLEGALFMVGSMDSSDFENVKKITNNSHGC